MNLIKTILPAILLSFLFNCSGTKSLERNELKEIQLENVRKLVEGRSFKFLAEAAYPMQTYDVLQVTNALLRNTGNTGSRISLIGNGDHLTFKDEKAIAELPYFGEIRMGTTINQQKGGINFNSTPINFEILENERKKMLTVNFDIRSKTETFEIAMKIYPNKNAVMYVSSINRTSIRFDGKVLELLKEETKPNQ